MKKSLHSICAVGFAAMLGGCGGANPPAGSAVPGTGAAASAGKLAPATKKAVVFIADLSANVVFYSANIHEKDPPQLGQITNGVTRSAAVKTDTHNVLYVLSFGGSGRNIEEYEPGSYTPFKTITAGLLYPSDLVIDSKGTLYVDNFNGHKDVLLEYAHGATSPTKTIVLPTIVSGGYGEMAFDPQHDLYLGASAREGSEQYLYEIPAGSKKAKQITLTDYPGSSIAIDGAGNLYACGGSGDIEVYKPGSTSPSYTAYASDAEVDGDITVTSNGTLYIPSYNGQMFEFAPGAPTPTNAFEVSPESAFGAAVGVLP